MAEWLSQWLSQFFPNEKLDSLAAVLSDFFPAASPLSFTVFTALVSGIVFESVVSSRLRFLVSSSVELAAALSIHSWSVKNDNIWTYITEVANTYSPPSS